MLVEKVEDSSFVGRWVVPNCDKDFTFLDYRRCLILGAWSFVCKTEKGGVILFTTESQQCNCTLVLHCMLYKCSIISNNPVQHKTQFCAQLYCTLVLHKSHFRSSVTLFWICNYRRTSIVKLRTIIFQSQFMCSLALLALQLM